MTHVGSRSTLFSDPSAFWPLALVAAVVLIAEPRTPAIAAAAQQTIEVRGIVKDTADAVIAGAWTEAFIVGWAVAVTPAGTDGQDTVHVPARVSVAHPVVAICEPPLRPR